MSLKNNNMDIECGTFNVTLINKEVVAANLPPLEHWLPLSNLDLLVPPLDAVVFFCYKKPTIKGPLVHDNNWTFGSMVSVLKKAMAQVLVPYYAFAGEIVFNSLGEPEILCNNRGVDFYEAYADVELKDLKLYCTDECVESKLVPKRKHGGVLAIQATELKCGSLFVGCSFDHRVADAYSANMFLVSYAEIAQSKPMSLLPSFRRSSLNPRRPGRPSETTVFIPISSLPLPPSSNVEPQANENSLVSRLYYIKANEINELQSLASSNGDKRSKLESLSAFLWKMVANSCKENGKGKVCNMGFVVDGRTRLVDDGVNKNASMSSYFGNVVSLPYGGKRVDELLNNPLSWVAREVHEILKSSVTKEHFLGLIDWVEALRPEPAMCKIYCSGGDNDGPAFVVSSGMRFAAGKVDFGWGLPFFGSFVLPWGGTTGFVLPTPSPAGNGDWIVYMHFSRGQLEFIETEANKIFRPLSYEYLVTCETAKVLGTTFVSNL